MARDYCQMDESNSKKQRYIPRIPSNSAMFTTPRSIDTKLYTDAYESIESVRSGNKSNVKALMNSSYPTFWLQLKSITFKVR